MMSKFQDPNVSVNFIEFLSAETSQAVLDWLINQAKAPEYVVQAYQCFCWSTLYLKDAQKFGGKISEAIQRKRHRDHHRWSLCFGENGLHVLNPSRGHKRAAGLDAPAARLYLSGNLKGNLMSENENPKTLLDALDYFFVAGCLGLKPVTLKWYERPLYNFIDFLRV